MKNILAKPAVILGIAFALLLVFSKVIVVELTSDELYARPTQPAVKIAPGEYQIGISHEEDTLEISDSWYPIFRRSAKATQLELGQCYLFQTWWFRNGLFSTKSVAYDWEKVDARRCD